MVIRIRSLSAVLAGALLLAACDDGRCPALARCDVRLAPCQAEALRQAACLRGRGESAEALKIPVETISREEFLASAEASASDETEADHAFRRGLALIGMYPEDGEAAEAERASASLVAAYYDDGARRITVIDDGKRMDSASQVLTLVHEMVHALQGAAGEFARRPERTRFDEQLALLAVTEGEAALLTDEAFVTGLGFDFDDYAYDASLYNYRASSLGRASRAEFPFDELALRFPYAYGASYLWPLRDEGGAGALAGAYDVFPNSTRSVLALDPDEPERYPNDLAELSVPELPDHTLVGSMHLGGFAYDVFSVVNRFRWFGRAMPRASAYRADTLSVFNDDAGGVIAVWRLRYDAAETATATAEALSALLTQMAEDEALTETAPWLLRVDVDDTDLVLIRAEDQSALDALPAELTYVAAGDADYTFGAADTSALRCMVPER